MSIACRTLGAARAVLAVPPGVRRMGVTAGLACSGACLTGRVPDTAILALAVVAGLPHGAFDHEAGRRVFASYGTRWWRPFLVGYLALLAAMLALWWTFPLVALTLFFVLSIGHFGSEDRPVGTARPIASTLVHGMIPIVVPAVCHPEAIGALLFVLVGPEAPTLQRFLAGPLAAAELLLALTVSVGYLRSGREPDREALGDLLCVGALFALASPLLAFSIYFALIHTPRALRQLAAEASLRSWTVRIRRSSPLAAAGLLLGAALFLLDRGGVGDRTIRTAFFLLGALTVPHMGLALLARRAGRPKGMGADANGVPCSRWHTGQTESTP